MGKLDVGAGGETATFRDLKSTCSVFRLTMALGTAAAGVRACLEEGETRHVRVEFVDGQLSASSVEPDDESGRCAVQAIGRGHFQGLTCTVDANVSR